MTSGDLTRCGMKYESEHKVTRWLQEEQAKAESAGSTW